MRYGIVIPTFGASANRLDLAVSSIQRFTKDLEYTILVSDDATDNSDWVGQQKEVCSRRGVAYRRCSEWSHYSGNLHQAGMLLSDAWDVLVFFSDDCLAPRDWLRAIDYWYENNRDLKPGSVCGPMVEAWELVLAGIIPTVNDFYGPYRHLVDGDVLRQELTDYPRDSLKQALWAKGLADSFIYPVERDLKVARPVHGGIGPCFSVLSRAFQEVGGFTKAPFVGDYEVMLGWQLWERGYSVVIVPGPPVYHARGLASTQWRSLNPNIDRDPQTRRLIPWLPEAQKSFQQIWGMSWSEAVQQYAEQHVYAAEGRVVSGKTLSLAEITRSWPERRDRPAGESTCPAAMTEVLTVPREMHRPDVTAESFRARGIWGHVIEESQIKRLKWVSRWGRRYLAYEHCDMLDLGCGVGDVTCAIRQQRMPDGFWRITGQEKSTCLDISPRELEVCRRVLPDCAYLCQDAQSFVEDAVKARKWFRLVVCCELIEHVIPHEAFKLIYNIAEICRFAIFTTPDGLGNRWDCAAGSGHTMLWTEDLLRCVLNPGPQAYSFMCDEINRKLPRLRYEIENIDNEFLGVTIATEHFGPGS